MKVHETRSHAAHAPSSDEEKMMTLKHKADQNMAQDGDQGATKKAKPENDDENAATNGKSVDKLKAEFSDFCSQIDQHLSMQQMKDVLEANEQDLSSFGSDITVSRTCKDVLFFGPLGKCPSCNGTLEFMGTNYSCKGQYSEWSSCTFATKNPPRKEEQMKLPESVKDSPVIDLLKKYQDPNARPKQESCPLRKPFTGMVMSLSGRLSQTHQSWRSEIEKHGGKVSNTVLGVTCLVVSPAEREQGGSSKMAEAVEREIPVVREAWLADSIHKQEPQSLQAYEVVADLAVYGKGIPLDKQDPGEEALETISSEIKLYGKKGVYKDTMLLDQGAKIFEKDGILYNCAFTLCDLGRGLNDYCIMQLITVPQKSLHMYYKKGRIGDDTKAEERLEEWQVEGDAIKEFVKLFEELTGNKFEPWEREKKFQKKYLKFYPIDMDVGIDARHGALGLRQLGIAAAHSKLHPPVAYFMKVLCSQEIYRYALMEMGLDSPDLPIGMLSDVHLKRCEEVLLEFLEKLKSAKESDEKTGAILSDFSQRWFTLMPSTRPFIFRSYSDLADYAAAGLETVRDITAASHVIGDMTGLTIDDPLDDRYKKLGCSISLVEPESDDYKMILNYLEKTYEPVKVGDVSYGISVERIYAVELGADPSYEEVKKLPNKVLLWCGTRSSNLLRHLHKGFLPSICSLPVPGYMFGKSIVCSDAAAEAARYGFTAVDRPEGFLVLTVASLGEEMMEVKSPPEDTKSLEEKKAGVKGLGKKKPDEAEHTVWKDNIKVPCGSLVSGNEGSSLEYNEYAVYDPKQVSIRFLVGVKYEEKDMEMDTEEQ